VGEIWLRSPHLAAGYLGDESLTAERFVTNPWTGDPTDRLYRTGDLGRYRPDGVVEAAGRADQQVKVRGFRVELGEVEAALLRHPAIRAAAAVARDDGRGDRTLAAYWVPADPGGDEPTAAALRSHLKAMLPDFMLPSAYVRLERLPLTANGKLDRRALPDPETDSDGSAEFVAPRTAAEEAVAAAWREVLGLDRVGVHDDFFALGGHSLRATQVLSRIDRALGVRLPVRAIFEAPTIAGLAAAVEAPAPRSRRPGHRRRQADRRRCAGEPGVHPLTFAQQRLWFVGQIESTVGYHLPVALRFRGALDAWVMERALEEIVRRHETLRTRIELRDGEPVQVVRGPAPLRLPIVPVDARAGETREETLLRLAAEEAARPFPEEGPFARATLLRAAEDDHVLLWTMHHLVGDGWSIGLFNHELAVLYRACSRGEPSPLPPLPTTYGIHARRQRQRLRGAALEAQLAYWRERFAGAPAVLELPTDRPRPPVPSGRGAAFPFALSAETAARVAALAREAGATPFMVLLAAFEHLLSRWSGQEDVVVGTPIANRTDPDVEALIGYFANTLALRTDLSGGRTFRDLLARVRETTLGAYEHQDLPFEKLVEEIRPPRSLSHSPVFQVMFNLQNETRGEGAAVEGLAASPLGRARPGARYDLTLSLAESGGRYVGSVEYATDLFDARTVERLAAQFARLVEAASGRPDAPVWDLPLLDEGDRALVLDAWNRTDAPLPSAETADALIAEHAARTPEAPAVSGPGGTLSYAALLRRADVIGAALRAMGAGPEVRVGLAVARGPEMLAAMIGVWRAGAAYVPLEPAHPAERLRYVMDDAGIRILLADRASHARLPDPGVPVLQLEEIGSATDDAATPAILPSARRGPASAGPHPPAPSPMNGRGGGAAAAPSVLPSPPAGEGAGEGGPSAESLAYVIYTSGSTGRPKGVMVPHGPLVAFLSAMIERPGMRPDERLLAITTPTFDMSVLELFMPLAAGGEVAVVDAETAADGARLGERLAGPGAPVLMATPATWRMLREAGWRAGAGMRAFSGGEALPDDLADALTGDGAELWNLYGPTETTVFSTVDRVERGTAPTLGRPVANTRVYVLDARLRPAPVGVPGELFIGGAGVTRGYNARPALTAERLRPRSVLRRPGRAAVPHRRPRALAGGRPAGVPGPHSTSR
jgi:amino acid adenylation domain-containing protein